jgi:NADH-dependent peroxiredoxin subunit C
MCETVAKIGQEAPDFEAEAFFKDDMTRIKLSEYRGKWVVLLFYPADFTFVCPTELEEAARYNEQFEANGAQLFSISTDTAFVHKAWHDTSPAIGKVNYPMLADPTGAICKSYGTYIEEAGLSWRATFIIDPDGILKAAEVHDNSIGRSAKEILRKVQAAKFVRENNGEVCPASWEPGDDTLTPGIDLIGKL